MMRLKKTIRKKTIRMEKKNHSNGLSNGFFFNNMMRLTSLETLDIEGCDTLQELPVTSMMTCLTLLTLDDCG